MSTTPPSGPHSLRRLSKFASVGVVNTTVDFTLFNVLVYLVGLGVVISNTVGYCAGMVTSFLLNKYWTFSESRDHGKIIHQLPLFLAFNLVGLGLSNLVVWLAAGWIAPVLAKLCAIGVTFVWNYWTSHRFVYRAA